MLHVWLGTCDGVAFREPNETFRFFMQKDWFEDQLVKDMVKDIDKSEIVSYKLTYDYMGDPMNTLGISGGVKCLIMLYKCPNVLVNGNCMGDNCAKWLPIISEKSKCYMTLTYGLMISDTIRDHSPFMCEIINNGNIAKKISEFYHEYYQYLRKVKHFPKWENPYDWFFTFQKARDGIIRRPQL